MPISLEERNESQAVEKAAQELIEPWRARNDQWIKDRRLLAMSYRRRINPFELILTNDIPVQHAFTVAILGGKPPVFRLPITLQGQGERDKMNRSERLVTGMWREAEKTYRAQGHGSLLHDLIFFAGLGCVCAFSYVEVNRVGRRNQPRFRVNLYDPINCYPEFGQGGLLRFARAYPTTYADAYSLAVSQGWDADKIEKVERDAAIKIINLWEKEESSRSTSIFNTVTIGGVPLKARTEHGEFDSIPITMTPMNGVPTQPFMASFDDQPADVGYLSIGSRSGSADWGRPVFHMNRELVPALDRNLTYSAEISRRTAFGKYAYVSEGGMQVMSPEEFEKTMVLNLAPGEEFKAILPPTGPRERETIIADLQQKIQQGSLNKLVFGQLDLEISGVTLERAISQAKALLEPYVSGVQDVISDLMLLLIGQLKKRNIKTISVSSRQEQLGPELGFMVEDFNVAEDLPTTTYLMTTLPMNLPDNRMQRISMARLAKPGNDPLLPDRVIREDILEVQDEALMERLLDEDIARRSPAIIAVKTLAGLRRMVEDWRQDDTKTQEEIDEALAALEVMRQEFRQVIAPRQQPATSMQAKQSEPSPEARTPEESGMPPAAAELAFNQSSAVPRQNGANRRAMLMGMQRG